jgi:5-methylcytosine-specific restriction enzyme A
VTVDLSTREGRQAFYCGRPWRKFRAWYLRQHPLCTVCEALGRPVAATELDHRVSLATGGEPLDADNVEPLCGLHHRQKTASERTGRPLGGCDVAGRPLDPSHPWRE